MTGRCAARNTTPSAIQVAGGVCSYRGKPGGAVLRLVAGTGVYIYA